MDKNNPNLALKIAREIILNFKSTENAVDVYTFCGFHHAWLLGAYEVQQLTKEEYYTLVDIVSILAAEKDTD